MNVLLASPEVAWSFDIAMSVIVGHTHDPV
jgi:hypothetical protein